jgi:energy-coupling factor transporter ATP-binding protein EcfA2
MIVLNELTYTYPNERDPALKGLSLEIEEGKFVAILGANLAGKTTLCFALSGFIPHFFHGSLEGSVQIGSINVSTTPLPELAGEVGLIFQNPFNQISGARFSVLEEVAFGLENIGVPSERIISRAEEALEIVGLRHLAERSPFALSGGEQQRLAIASVLAMDPKVLILDEPTSQLDPLGTKQVFRTLNELRKQGDRTVILVEQKIEWVASFADQVILMAHGEIVAHGDPSTLLASEKVPRYGIGQTRYTEAGRLAQKQGLVPPEKPLPVTQTQAEAFFR